MSLRTVKTGIKRVAKQNKIVAEMKDNVYWDETQPGIGTGNSILQEYLNEEIHYAHMLYSRLMKAFNRLTIRQQKKIVRQSNANQDKRRVTDKLTSN